MIIVIKNIPHETTNKELTDFIKEAGIHVLIDEMVIFSRPDVDAIPLERIALIWLSPKEAGVRVINKLNNSLFKGQCINVREYITRSTDKNPKENTPNQAINFKEKNVLERRRKPLIIPWKINDGQLD